MSSGAGLGAAPCCLGNELGMSETPSWAGICDWEGGGGGGGGGRYGWSVVCMVS